MPGWSSSYHLSRLFPLYINDLGFAVLLLVLGPQLTEHIYAASYVMEVKFGEDFEYGKAVEEV